MGKKNIADSNSQNYLERKVELCIEIIERELYKQFKNVGIGFSDKVDFVSAYMYCLKKVSRKYRRQCSPEEFSDIFNKKIKQNNKLKISTDLVICKRFVNHKYYSNGEYVESDVKYEENNPTVYWCGVKEINSNIIRKVLKSFFWTDVYSRIFEKMKEYYKEHIVFSKQTFYYRVYNLLSDTRIKALQMFGDISNDTFIKHLKAIAKSEEIEMKIEKNEEGRLEIKFSVTLDEEGINKIVK